MNNDIANERVRRIARMCKQGAVLQKLKEVDDKLTPSRRTADAVDDMVNSPWLTIPAGVLSGGYLGGKAMGINFDPMSATVGGIMGHLISNKHNRYKRLKRYVESQGIPQK